MNSLTKREKRLLTILFVLILCVLYYNFIAEPLIEELRTADSKLHSNKKILEGLKESQKSIDEIRKQADYLGTQADKSAVSLPNGAKVPEIIVFLNDITALSGCRSEKVSFGQPVKKDSGSRNGEEAPGNNAAAREESLMIQPVMYEVTGGLEGIMTLLDRIEQSDRKILVDKISIVKDEENNNLNANLNMSCFYLMKEGSPAQNYYPFVGNTLGKKNIFD